VTRKTGLSLAAATGALATLVLAPRAVLALGATASGLALDAAVTSLFLSLVAVAFCALAPEPLGQRLGLGPGRLAPGRTAFLVAGLVGLSQALDGTIRLLGLDAGSALERIDAIVADARGDELLLLLAGAACAAGVGEELFARGWIQRGLARRFGRGVALLVSAAVFGVLHGDAVHAAAAFGLGLYLGAMAEATGAIRAGILAHVTNNAIALVTSAFELAPPEGVGAASAALAGAALAASGLAAAWPGRGSTARAATAVAPEP